MSLSFLWPTWVITIQNPCPPIMTIIVSDDSSDIMCFENWGPFGCTETILEKAHCLMKKTTINGWRMLFWFCLFFLQIFLNTWVHIFLSFLKSKYQSSCWLWKNVKLNYLHKEHESGHKTYLLYDQWYNGDSDTVIPCWWIILFNCWDSLWSSPPKHLKINMNIRILFGCFFYLSGMV